MNIIEPENLLSQGQVEILGEIEKFMITAEKIWNIKNHPFIKTQTNDDFKIKNFTNNITSLKWTEIDQKIIENWKFGINKDMHSRMQILAIIFELLIDTAIIFDRKLSCFLSSTEFLNQTRHIYAKLNLFEQLTVKDTQECLLEKSWVNQFPGNWLGSFTEKKIQFLSYMSSCLTKIRYQMPCEIV